MDKHSGKTFEEAYTAFITAKTAKGVSDVTIRNYHQNLHNISLHFDISAPFDMLTKEMLNEMVVEEDIILRDASINLILLKRNFRVASNRAFYLHTCLGKCCGAQRRCRKFLADNQLCFRRKQHGFRQTDVTSIAHKMRL